MELKDTPKNFNVNLNLIQHDKEYNHRFSEVKTPTKIKV